MNKIYLIVFISIICSVALAQESAESKYIDSLPEEEKQVVVERVARRILEEVESKKVPDKSQVNLTNHELDLQSEYVQKIIQEESEKLKRYHSIYASKTTNGKDKITRSYIDLTQPSSTSNIEKREVKLENYSIYTKSKPLTEKYLQNLTTFVDNPTTVTLKDRVQDTTITLDLVTKAEKHLKQRDRNGLTPYPKDSPIVNVILTNYSTSTPNSNLAISSKKSINFTKDNREEQTKNLLTTRAAEIKPLAVKNSLRNNTNTYVAFDTLTTQSSIASLTTEDSIYSVTTHTSEKKETVSHDQVATKSEEQKIKKSNESMKFEDLEAMRLVTQKDILRNGQAFEKDNRSKVREYVVFEVDPDETPFVLQQPKSKKKKLERNREQPFYVPIYNYDPEYAYFNAKNHWGPTEEQNSDSDVDYGESLNVVKKKKKSSISYENDRKYQLNSKLSVADVPNILQYFRPLTKVVPLKKFRHDDYYDFDYYYGRTNHKKPETRGTKINLDDLKQTKLKRKKGLKSTYLTLSEPSNIINLKKLLKENRELLTQYETNDDSKYLTNFNTDPLKDTRNTHKKRNKISNKVNIDRDLKLVEKLLKQVLRDGESNEADLDYFKSTVQDLKKKLKSFLKETAPGVNPLRPSYNGIKDVYQSNEGIPIFTFTTPEITTPYDFEHASEEVESTTEPLQNVTVIEEDVGEVEDIVKDDVLRTSADDIEPYLTALGDMIHNDSKGLVQYDWLGTTVDIEAGLTKLIDLSNSVLQGKSVHPADAQILTYTNHIYYIAKADKENHIRFKLMQSATKVLDVIRKSSFPRNKKLKPGDKIKNPLKKIEEAHKSLLRDLNEVLQLKKRNNISDKQRMMECRGFLIDLQKSMNFLHDAIKQISIVTKYNQQTWFRDLKDLYLKKATREHLLQILLHLSSVRLLSLIEDSSGKGLEDDYLLYVSKHKKEVSRTKSEMKFVRALLREMGNKTMI